MEWVAHSRLVMKAGITQSVIDAICAGLRPEFEKMDEQTIYDFYTHVFEVRAMEDAVYEKTVERAQSADANDHLDLL